jgi:hypothetical protein
MVNGPTEFLMEKGNYIIQMEPIMLVIYAKAMLMDKEGLSVPMIGFLKVSYRMSKHKEEDSYIIDNFDINTMVSGQVICQMALVTNNGIAKRLYMMVSF